MAASTNKSALWKHIGLHGHSVGTFVGKCQWKGLFNVNLKCNSTEK